MPPPSSFVDNAPLRAAFLAGSFTPGRLGHAVGKMRTSHVTRVLASGEKKRYPYRVGDGTAVKRDLGLVPNIHGGRGKGGMRRRINPEKALRYAEALGIDPRELGL